MSVLVTASCKLGVLRLDLLLGDEDDEFQETFAVVSSSTGQPRLKFSSLPVTDRSGQSAVKSAVIWMNGWEEEQYHSRTRACSSFVLLLMTDEYLFPDLPSYILLARMYFQSSKGRKETSSAIMYL